MFAALKPNIRPWRHGDFEADTKVILNAMCPREASSICISMLAPLDTLEHEQPAGSVHYIDYISRSTLDNEQN